MPVTLTSAHPVEIETVEQRFVIGRIAWDAYVSMSDALAEHPGIRLVYCDGRLTIMGKSRRHEWLSECLGHLVMAIAVQMGIPCEPAGEATYRRPDKEASLEGDRTFHLGESAERMRGGKNYDFSTDPPPDLAIEVEVSHSADDAIEAWGRMGVSEVWRFDAANFACSFWNRRGDGSYQRTDRSMFLPKLGPDDVVEMIRQAQASGTGPWLAQLPNWVERVLRPRENGVA